MSRSCGAKRWRALWLVSVASLLALLHPGFAPGQAVPAAIVTEDVPPIPAELARRAARYRTTPSAELVGWFAGRREILMRAGAGPAGTAQVCNLVMPNDAWNPMTQFVDPVRGVRPRPNRNQLAFEQDVGGNESFRLALFDAAARRTRFLVNQRSRQEGACWSRDGRLLAFSGDARNGKDRDIYVLDPDRGQPARRLLELKGQGTIGDWSPDSARLAVVVVDLLAGARIHLLDVATGRSEPVVLPENSRLPPDGTGVRWSADGRSLYWTTIAGSEFRRLVRHDLKSGTTISLSDSIPWDVEEYDLSDDNRILVAANEDGLSRLHLFDGTTGQERRLPVLPAGQVSRVTFRPGGAEFAFNLETAQDGLQIESYHWRSGHIEHWTPRDPALARLGPFAEPELVRYPTFDDRKVPAYLYRPGHRFRGRRPVLIDIHGGPESQFRPGYLGAANAVIDELGVTLIYPNVRGSSGYGRTYAHLDDGLRREDAVKDVGALLDWIAAQPDLDASRVAVTGGSYGGFLALAVLVRYGDRLRAGTCQAGISNLVTLLEQTKGFRLDAARLEFGDERDPGVREALLDVSPLNHADRIKVPLLVIHGRNDPRVPVAEAERIIAAVRKNGNPVWSVLVSGEGHSLARHGNSEYVQNVELQFLMRYLLGTSRPAPTGLEP
jgi:dipeptidyl aminopeptidase/acylaminoacyl peptidase